MFNKLTLKIEKVGNRLRPATTKRILFMTAFLILVAFPGNASAALEESQTVSSLRRDIILLNLINSLHLSEEQISEFLLLLRKVEEVREESQDRLNRELRELEEDLIELRTALVRGRGAYRGRKSRIARRYENMWGIKRRDNQKLGELTEEALGLLREGQLEMVGNFSACCLIPARDLRFPARIGEIRKDISRATKFLDRIRALPQHRLAEEREKIVEALVGIMAGRRQLSPEEREMKEEMAAQHIKEVRNLSDADFQLRKGELSERIAGRQEVTGKEKERIRRWRVRHFLLDERLIPLLTGAADFCSEERAGIAERVRQLETEVARLILIRRLHLTDSQIQELLANLKEARIEEYLAENYRREEPLRQAFTDLRRELLQGQWAGQEVEEKAARLNHQVRQFRREYLARLMEIEKEIREVLTGAQLLVVENFKPRRVLTRDEPDTVFKSHREAERLLTRGREIVSERTFERRAERLLGRYVTELSSIYEEILPQEEREGVRGEIARFKESFLKVLSAARLLSPQEFSRKREELLRELLPRLREERWTEKRRLGKVGEYLLHPEVILLLEKEL